MQLKQQRNVTSLRAGLMAASCALLAPVTNAQTPPADDTEGTQLDTGLLYYQEDKGRVRSVDAIVKLSRDYGDERVLGATLAIDSLTGGSPNGAIPSHGVQTFASPSATSLSPSSGTEDEEGKLYTVAAGRQPLYREFHDLRAALDLNWSQPLGRDNKLSVGGHLSHEYDFLSVSGSGALSRDFNSKNTTLGLGLSAEFDQIKAVGGTPEPGSSYNLQDKTEGNESKKVYGAQLSLTQVLTRSWIAQLNLSVDRANGYLNDPYKILSRVDASGGLLGYQFENRPDSHARRSLYLGNKVALGRSTLDLSLRYGSDDWGIHSQTAEVHYRMPLSARMYIEPQLRWYRQDAADFYRLYLTSADPSGASMSADPRLAAFTATTFGVKLGMPRPNGDEIGLRLEAYQQNPKQQHSALPALAGLDLNPSLRAMMLQLDWRFKY